MEDLIARDPALLALYRGFSSLWSGPRYEPVHEASQPEPVEKEGVRGGQGDDAGMSFAFATLTGAEIFGSETRPIRIWWK